MPKAFLIWLIVIAALIFLLNIKIKFRGELFNGGYVLFIKILFININLKKIIEKKQRKNILKSKEIEQKKADKEGSNFKDILVNIKEGIPAIKEALDLIKDSLQIFGRKLAIDKLNADIVITADDAFNAAMLYGFACSVIYPLDSLIKSRINVKEGKININTNFLPGDIKYRCDIQLSLKIFDIFIIITTVAIKGRRFYSNNKKLIKKVMQE